MDTIVTLAGDLDISRLSYVRQTLSSLDRACVIDLTDVRYLDSSTLGELARYAKRILPARATLSNVCPHVRHVLEIVCFDVLFDIEPASSSGGLDRRRQALP